LYVPSIGLIVGGDAVYNGIHPYLGETDAQSPTLESLTRSDGYPDSAYEVMTVQLSYSTTQMYESAILLPRRKRPFLRVPFTLKTLRGVS
jgi:hypothetical protein